MKTGSMRMVPQAACVAEVKDLPALDQAIQISQSWHGSMALYQGFAEADGRAYLLQKLNDPKIAQTPELRATYARALESGVWSHNSAPVAGEKFLEAIAQLAIQSCEQNDEATASILLAHLHTAADIHEQTKRQTALPAGLEADLVAALTILQSHCEKVSSPRLRFSIDTVLLVASPELGFKPAAGPVPTILTIPGPERHYATKPGHLTYEYSYASARTSMGKNFWPVLVLEDVKTHKAYEVPLSRAIGGGSAGGAGDMVPLPADLPQARYRVFIRVKGDGQAVSDGQGVEWDLPTNP